MVQWSASNDNATVDQTGKVTGRKAGTVTITAKENGFTTSHTMTVIDPVGGDTTNINHVRLSRDERKDFRTVRPV